MMKVSTKTRYSLRIMLQLAEKASNNEAVRGKDIALIQRITEPYMEQIMIKLRKAGWVTTERGRCGGYRLNISPEKISVLDLIELFEGQLEFVSCSKGKTKCLRRDKCKTTLPWRMLAESFAKEAKKMTLNKIMKLNSEIKEYVI
jgi:Rrf2 family protein